VLCWKGWKNNGFAAVDNLDDVIAFARVVERHSFVDAARDLRLSSSLISKRVTRLEETLGVQLINRSTRRLSLTDAGSEFYKGCARAFAELDAARIAATECSEQLTGRLKVHATRGAGQRLLAEGMTEFMSRYPGMELELTIDSGAVNLLRAGVDVLIRSADLKDSTLDYRDLGPIGYNLCASPQFLNRHGAPEHPRDLARFNCLIHSGRQRPQEWDFTGPDGDYTVRVDGNFFTNDGSALYTAATMGIGIARIPDYMMHRREDFRTNRLRVLLPGTLRSNRALRAYFPRSRRMPVKLQVFLDYMQQYWIERANAPRRERRPDSAA
jgi:DNA-binding transcriptional LysR family regulator